MQNLSIVKKLLYDVLGDACNGLASFHQKVYASTVNIFVKDGVISESSALMMLIGCIAVLAMISVACIFLILQNFVQSRQKLMCIEKAKFFHAHIINDGGRFSPETQTYYDKNLVALPFIISVGVGMAISSKYL